MISFEYHEEFPDDIKTKLRDKLKSEDIYILHHGEYRQVTHMMETNDVEVRCVNIEMHDHKLSKDEIGSSLVPRVKCLAFDNISFKDEDIVQLTSKFTSVMKLEWLKFYDCNLNEEQLITLFRSAVIYLEEFDIGWNKITERTVDDLITTLDNTKHCKSVMKLKRLKFYDCNLNEEQLITLFRSAVIYLEDFEISDNEITERTVDDLITTLDNTKHCKLKNLEIVFCNLSDESEKRLNELQTRHPNIKIDV